MTKHQPGSRRKQAKRKRNPDIAELGMATRFKPAVFKKWKPRRRTLSEWLYELGRVIIPWLVRTLEVHTPKDR